MIKRTILAFYVLIQALLAQSQNSLTTTGELVFASYETVGGEQESSIASASQLFKEFSGVNATIKSYPTPASLLEAMGKGEVDVVFANTSLYLQASEALNTYEPVAQPNLPHALSTMFVMGQNVEMNSLKEVVEAAADIVLVLVNPRSASGDLVPRLKLSSMMPGIPERFFLEIQYAATPAEAIIPALQGEYSLCTITPESYRALGGDTLKLKKLWESPSVPIGAIMAKRELSGSVREQLESFFLDLHQSSPEVFQSIRNNWIEGKNSDRFVKANPAQYDALLNLSVNRQVAAFIIKAVNN